MVGSGAGLWWPPTGRTPLATPLRNVVWGMRGGWNVPFGNSDAVVPHETPVLRPAPRDVHTAAQVAETRAVDTAHAKEKKQAESFTHEEKQAGCADVAKPNDLNYNTQSTKRRKKTKIQSQGSPPPPTPTTAGAGRGVIHAPRQLSPPVHVPRRQQTAQTITARAQARPVPRPPPRLPPNSISEKTSRQARSPPSPPTPRTNTEEWGGDGSNKKRSRHPKAPRGAVRQPHPSRHRGPDPLPAPRPDPPGIKPRNQDDDEARPSVYEPPRSDVHARRAHRRPPLDPAAPPINGHAHGPRRAAVPPPVRGRMVEAAREKNVTAHGVGRPTRRQAAAGRQRQRCRRLGGGSSGNLVEAAQPAVAAQRLVRQRVDDGRGGGARGGGQLRRPGALEGAITSRPAHSSKRWGKRSW